jgi:hypothetical protein
VSRVKVFLTTDVEYTGLEEYRRDPEYVITEASMDCLADGKPAGLPYIAGTLGRHGLKGTFFVEPLCAYHFGEQALARNVGRLLEAKQDVQLHLHPSWLAFRDRAAPPPQDPLYTYDGGRQAELIGLGKGLLEKHGAEIRAFRAGSFAADDRTYAALRAHGIGISSSYNQEYLGGQCRITSDRPRNDAFPAREGIVEVPLTNFLIRDLRSFLGFRPKTFQVGSTRAGTARKVLDAAVAEGLSCVTILMHNFEFVDRRKPGWLDRPMRARAPIMQAFEGTCAYLAAHPDRFEVTTFGEAAADPEALLPRDPGRAAVFPRIQSVYLPM